MMSNILNSCKTGSCNDENDNMYLLISYYTPQYLGKLSKYLVNQVLCHFLLKFLGGKCTYCTNTCLEVFKNGNCRKFCHLQFFTNNVKL